MRIPPCIIHLLPAVAVVCLARPAAAEKVLIYDEQRGIIFADKDEAGQIKAPPPPPPKSAEKPSVAPERKPPARPRAKEEILAGHGKDPPDVYFKSGLEYFGNGDYENALRNFTFADSTDPQPQYALWVGKSLRQLHRPDQMLFVMNRILTTYPEGDVADDALFEIAFHHQTIDDYDGAISLYTRLAEQYPFGTSYSSGESFMEIAKEQRQTMRGEMLSTLRILGCKGEELEDLYKDFQRSHAEPVTGRGDGQTVKSIKAVYQAYLARESAKAAENRRLEARLHWAIVAGCFLFALLFAAGVQLVVIRAKARQLASLNQLLHDLDVRSL